MDYLKLMKKTIIILTAILGMLTCCKKIYNPAINNQLEALVVDGLITNTNGPYSVRLSKAVPYDSAAGRLPAIGALVTINDNNQNSYQLNEGRAGVYNSDKNFVGLSGSIYTLHIQTSQGDIYESSPQLLPPPPSFDSIHGFISAKEILIETSGNGYLVSYINGVNVLLDLNKQSSELLPLSRFKSSLIIEYTYSEQLKGPPPPLPKTFYFWNTFSLDNNENITGSKYNTNNASIKNQSVCFFSTSKQSYNIGDTSSIKHFILTFKQYNLNSDTYNYYKGVNGQLASEGRLFDPIASQLNGNIKCINDSRKLVLGLFEASSIQTVTYIVQPNEFAKSAIFKKINNLGPIPGSGVTIDSIPYFWVN